MIKLHLTNLTPKKTFRIPTIYYVCRSDEGAYFFMHFPTASVERYSSDALEHQKMHRTLVLQSSDALET